MYVSYKFVLRTYYNIIIIISKGRKRKILNWFETVFNRVTGGRDFLVMEEFVTAVHINGVYTLNFTCK